ncbi:hypothetical protein BCR33DRAFT_720426 [Rhizoclosmatium globosum]|uniref:Uncharacterized protein n=1 Tax=Rhizoclosmatium globosum TaxID=329046 RepID=A0A1Y2BWR7_9FUNG|nr:hypothetical protein BCR33DRAFT_720426 [Rhizoclosmatium globosum]|eukprot:ORY39196.1 hypothetical protein BCR33DRAFT_720426 [Rhizoclosmatium globosum]
MFPAYVNLHQTLKPLKKKKTTNDEIQHVQPDIQSTGPHFRHNPTYLSSLPQAWTRWIFRIHTSSTNTCIMKLPPPATDDEIKDRELWELELIMVARHEQNKALYAAAHKEAMDKWRQDGANWKRL